MSQDSIDASTALDIAYKQEAVGKAIYTAVAERWPWLDRASGELDMDQGDLVMLASMLIELSQQQQKILDVVPKG